MRAGLLLVICGFLSSSVQASLEFDSGVLSCADEPANCSSDLVNISLSVNTARPLPPLARLELSNFITYPVQPAVQFRQTSGGSPIAQSVVPRTLLAGTIIWLNPNRELIWNTAGAGDSVSLNTGQLGAGISISGQSGLVLPRASLTPSPGEITILSPGGSISADNGGFVSLQTASILFTQSLVEMTRIGYGGTISVGSGSLSSLNSASTPANLLSSNAAFAAPLPASFNLLLAGLAFMLFASRRSAVHKPAAY
ncbi:MAG: hypothetical protein M0R33_10980 [Methylomonas sp.]|jgi:hypothetical protein|uniref:hypothetical protein n=1 Tax=Methylomonas sp. TaxID=418 RepID=UPI0025ED7E2C|nr:hypothetical protein [Methylomonas sp.]MCK9606955.1 hypothetical protein [Methylomonas sp.]